MAEVEIHEEKVFAHLDEQKEHDTGTWVLDTGAMNHMSRCWAAFMKINTTVLGTVCFGDDSVVRIEGYFIPHLMINIVSIRQLNEIGYKIDIDTGVMKIWEPGGVLLARVKREGNRLYLLHLMFTQPTCLVVRGRGDEVAWH
jgi:hypothetical protein